MKNRGVSSRLHAVFITFALVLVNSVFVLAVPGVEDFNSAGVGDKGTQRYTLNGITYTTNDVGGQNISIVDDGWIASDLDLALGYRSSGANQTTQVSFGTADGSEFKLNSFQISTGLGDITVLIKGYRDNLEVASDFITTENFTTFDVSENSNWEYINEVRMMGEDLDIDIDDVDFSPGVSNTYYIVYDGNSNTSGFTPVDSRTYANGETVTVLGNTGSMVRDGYAFAGWNTAADGSGTEYNSGYTFIMGASDVTLYAQWLEEDYYVITYNGNSNTGGFTPVDSRTYANGETVTVLGNTGSMVRDGYAFAGWNTAADGSGTECNSGDTFIMGASDVTLYAQWLEKEYYVITYNGNSNTGGFAPVDSRTYANGETVTVLGNTGSMVRDGYTFAGWNTAADGSGSEYNSGDTFIMGTSDVTLYAQWAEEEYYVITYNGNSNTNGFAPVDSSTYANGKTVTVLGNTGSMVRDGYTFAGWNTAADGSGTKYNSGDSFIMGASDVTLYAQWSKEEYHVTYDGNGNTSGSLPLDETAYYNGDTVIVMGNSENLLRVNYIFSGWNTSAEGSGNAYNGGDVLTMGNNNITLYAQWTARKRKSGGGNGSDTLSNQKLFNTGINDQVYKIATETKVLKNGKSIVILKIDDEMIESIREANKSNATDSRNVIQLLTSDIDCEGAQFELTGSLVKSLQDTGFDMQIKYEDVEYIIPAEELSITKVSKELGNTNTEYQNILFKVSITKLNDDEAQSYKEMIRINNAELVFQPVEFKIVLTRKKANGSEQEQNVCIFSNYVERIMEIPEGTDSNKITTGIVFNLDGTYSHVPTRVYQSDGKWYAALNSMTNSNYAVIWNDVRIKSVDNHWAKDVVNDMASRLIIVDPQNFMPDKAVTRADFAEYIVRALGLYREDLKLKNSFIDVDAADKRSLAILIANEYGVVSGYADGTFKGNNPITREEAMVMYRRAMKITKLIGSDENRFQTFTDYNQVSDWASMDVKEVLSAHVFNGTTAATISPKATLTYAESVQAIKSLLAESNLIN